MSGFIDDLLNFLIPIAVFLFIFWIFYRIPIIHDGIDRLRDWWANRSRPKEETSTLRSITYE